MMGLSQKQQDVFCCLHLCLQQCTKNRVFLDIIKDGKLCNRACPKNQSSSWHFSVNGKGQEMQQQSSESWVYFIGTGKKASVRLSNFLYLFSYDIPRVFDVRSVGWSEQTS